MLLWALRAIVAASAVGLMIGMTGCTRDKDALVAPRVLLAPYDTSQGEVLWAVAPLRNESGTTEAEKGAVSDKIVAAVEQTEGLRCLPLNRTLEAMRALKIERVTTPAQVKQLAQAMGVDGILVGSITSYDPYTPSIGIALALYARPGSMERWNGRQINPTVLEVQPTERPAPTRSNFPEGPASVYSASLDAKSHQVQIELREYGRGRVREDSALGWKRYMASMHLYTEFAAYHAVDGLLRNEWVRLTRERGEVGTPR
jgi:hypothetical protein